MWTCSKTCTSHFSEPWKLVICVTGKSECGWFVPMKCLSLNVSKTHTNVLPMMFVCFLIKTLINLTVDFSGEFICCCVIRWGYFFCNILQNFFHLLKLLHTNILTHDHSNTGSCSQMKLLNPCLSFMAVLVFLDVSWSILFLRPSRMTQLFVCLPL